MGIIQAFFVTPAKIHIPSLTLPFWPLQYLFSLCWRASLRTKIILCRALQSSLMHLISALWMDMLLGLLPTEMDWILSGLHI